MMKQERHVLNFCLILAFLLIFSLNVHSTIVYSECAVVSKDPELNIDCLYGDVRVYNEKVNSLELISFPEDITEDLSSEKVQELIFNNKTYSGDDSVYNGFHSFGYPGEYEFLVNGKYLKLKVFMSVSHSLETNSAVFSFAFMLIALAIILIVLSFAKPIKPHKKIKHVLRILGTIVIILALVFLISFIWF